MKQEKSKEKEEVKDSEKNIRDPGRTRHDEWELFCFERNWNFGSGHRGLEEEDDECECTLGEGESWLSTHGRASGIRSRSAGESVSTKVEDEVEEIVGDQGEPEPSRHVRSCRCDKEERTAQDGPFAAVTSGPATSHSTIVDSSGNISSNATTSVAPIVDWFTARFDGPQPAQKIWDLRKASRGREVNSFVTAYRADGRTLDAIGDADDWQYVSITVDFGAAESVMPPETCRNYPLLEGEEKRQGAYYIAANGEELENGG